MRNLTLYLLTFAFLLPALSGNAQFQNYFNDSTQAFNKIEIGGDYNLGAAALNAAFINTFYFKNHISEDLKSKAGADLKELNNFGGDLNYGITYTHFNKDSVGLWGLKNTGYFMALKNRQHVDGRFTKDLFNIVFNGNQDYRGKTADLSNFNLNELNYQQFEFGLIKNFTRNEKQFTIGGGLSLLNGQKHVSVTIDKGSLYTQQDGEYIDLTTNLSMQQSDTSHQKFGASNGLGLSSHIYFSYLTTKGGQLKFEMSDLGFIRWNQKSTQVNLDTSMHFEGVAVSNIFDFKDPAYSTVPSDTAYIAKFLKHVKHEAYNSYLPALFQLSFNQTINQFTFLSGIKYRLKANFIPYVFMGIRYQLNNNFYASGILSYGAYSRFNLGLEVGKKFAFGTALILGSQFVNGYIFPMQASAQGIYIALIKTF
jgi:hypothetical protein